MSTQTTNLDLTKQANSENWSNDIHNANLQKIDEAFAHLIDPPSVESDLNNCKMLGFYRSNPSTSNNPVSGYFSIFVVPFVGNRDIAQIAIEVNTNRMFVRTLHDSTTWTAWKELTETSQTASVTLASGVSNLFFSCMKCGNIVTLNGAVSLSSAIAGTNAVIITLPAGFRPSSARDIVAYTTYAGNQGMFHFTVKTDGSIITNVGGSNVSGTILFSCAFCI